MTNHFSKKIKLHYSMKLKALITAIIFIILESNQIQAQTKGLTNFMEIVKWVRIFV